jgi:hypothetical protein
MITIENNQIHRDGEHIGDIIGETAWMKEKQPGVIAGQIRRAAGIDGLKFEIVDTPEEEAKLSATEVFHVSPPVAEAGPVVDAGPATTFNIAGFGEPGTEYFRRCFVNHYGNDNYAAFMKSRGL